LLIFSLSAYLEALSYPYQSAYFPRIIIGLIALMSCALLGKAIYTVRRDKIAARSESQNQEEGRAFLDQRAAIKVAIMTAGSLIYLIILSYAGFFVTTIVYLPIMIRLLGVKKLRVLAFSTFVVVAFIYLIFVVFLKVPVPEGVLF